MSIRSISFFISTVILMSFGSWAVASDEPPGKAAARAGDTAKDVADLIRQLDAPEFVKRQDASQKLAAIGEPAMPALTDAALGESLEASTRAIAILKKLLREGNDPARSAARRALERIAKDGRTVAAKAAEEALTPRPDESPNLPGRLQVDGGAIQIQLHAAVGAGSRSVSSRSVNGVREVNVSEPNRRITIVDNPASGIRVEITEKKGGKEETKKYEAKDAAELKAKHPEAHKVYEEFTQMEPPFPLRLGNLRDAAIVPPTPALTRIPNRRTTGPQLGESIANLQKRLDEVTEILRKRFERTDNADDLAKALEQLDAARRELRELRARTGG